MNNASKVSSKYKLAFVIAILFSILTVQSKTKVFLQNSFQNRLLKCRIGMVLLLKSPLEH